MSEKLEAPVRLFPDGSFDVSHLSDLQLQDLLAAALAERNARSQQTAKIEWTLMDAVRQFSQPAQPSGGGEG